MSDEKPVEVKAAEPVVDVNVLAARVAAIEDKLDAIRRFVKAGGFIKQPGQSMVLR